MSLRYFFPPYLKDKVSPVIFSFIQQILTQQIHTCKVKKITKRSSEQKQQQKDTRNGKERVKRVPTVPTYIPGLGGRVKFRLIEIVITGLGAGLGRRQDPNLPPPPSLPHPPQGKGLKLAQRHTRSAQCNPGNPAGRGSHLEIQEALGSHVHDSCCSN
jgi:hypothetical protein